MPKKHKLGVNKGQILEYEDGTAAYRLSGIQRQQFRVKIADVTGFSVTKGRGLGRTLHLLGHGTELATMDFDGSTGEKVEKWFGSNPRSEPALRRALRRFPDRRRLVSPTNRPSWLRSVIRAP